MNTKITVKKSNLLIDNYPDLVKSEWDWIENDKNKIYPDEIGCFSHVKASWHCTACKGSYEMTVCNKINGQGCPYCVGKKVLKGFNDLQSNYPELIASSWNWIENDKNKLKPDEITSHVSIKACWHCSVCKGKYEMTVYNKVSGQGCPYCNGKRVLVGFNDLQSQYPKLVASEWDWIENDKNGLKPDGITSHSNVKANWHCTACKGHYEMMVNNKTKGKGCPYCAGQKVLPGFNDLESCYPEIAKEWYQPLNGSITPSMVTKSSTMIKIQDYDNPDETIRVKPAWKCSKCGHTWRAVIYSRTGIIQNGCPECAKHNHISAQENQVASFIEEHMQLYYPDCKHTMKRSMSFKEIYESLHYDLECLSKNNVKHLRKELDIYIPELNLAVEYDGDYWHDDKIVMQRKRMRNDDVHAIKTALCDNVGIELVFINEKDWLHDNVRIKQQLIGIIDKHMNCIQRK